MHGSFLYDIDKYIKFAVHRNFPLMVNNIKLKKYQLLLISLLGGILLSISWPVRGFPFISFIALIPFLFISDYTVLNKGFSRFAGFVYSYPGFVVWNLLTTWWIYISTEVGFVLAIGLNSLFMALIIGLYCAVRKVYKGKKIYFALIFFWISFEYLHLDWDLSWPWLNLGNVFAAYPKVFQWYEYTGTFGGTLWVLMVNILIYEVLLSFFEKKQAKIKTSRIVLCLIIILLPLTFSFYKYNNYSEKSNPRNIVVVQPNIDPYNEKFGEMTTSDQLDKLINAAIPLIDSATDYLVCPETSIPDGIWEGHLNEYLSIKQLRKLILTYPKLKIIIGASTFGMFSEKNKSETARKYTGENFWYDIYNTGLQIDSTDSIQTYHKSKLVPGVEEMPFAKILKPLEKLAIKLGGMSGTHGVQKERSVLYSRNDSIKIGTAICYESVYGEFLTGYIKKGAEFIFIITNDGWWGNTAGHRQHLQYARLRAVETRRSIARSANTGISAFINQRGDILQQTSWWVTASLKDRLNANNTLTFYVRHGDYIGKISLIAGLILLLHSIVLAVINRFKK